MAKKAKKTKRKKQPQDKITPPRRKSAGPPFYKQLLLAVAAVLLLYIFFSIPNYKWWLTERIFRYYEEVSHQWKTRGVEERLMERQRYNYLFPKLISEHTPQGAFILLPSRDYAKKTFSGQLFQWYHAAWNYYYFGPRRYVNYDPEAEQDLSPAAYAIVCNVFRPENSGEAPGLLIAKSEVIVPPAKNERGETVNIRLVTIDSPEVLQAVLADYRKKG